MSLTRRIRRSLWTDGRRNGFEEATPGGSSTRVNNNYRKSAPKLKPEEG